ncbi:MAG: hypothetical protein R6V58_05315 [Planctomycetota bacterium]
MDGRRKDSKGVRGFAGIAVVAVAALAIMWAGWPRAQAEPDDGAEAVVQVGTYQPRTVFQNSPAGKELMEEVQAIRPAMAKAQQAGDQQKLQQLQTQFQKKQKETVEKFERDIEKVLPGVAKAAGVKVIALEVVYAAEGVETEDVTAQVTKALGGQPEDAE